MPIKIVAESAAPQRMFKLGTYSSKQDYVDVMNALRTMKVGDAIVVDLNPKEWEGVDKYAMKFAATMRRHFEAKGLSITAYQSGPSQVTVCKATPLNAPKKRAARK
jgi:hypothetical protein